MRKQSNRYSKLIRRLWGSPRKQTASRRQVARGFEVLEDRNLFAAFRADFDTEITASSIGAGFYYGRDQTEVFNVVANSDPSQHYVDMSAGTTAMWMYLCVYRSDHQLVGCDYEETVGDKPRVNLPQSPGSYYAMIEGRTNTRFAYSSARVTARLPVIDEYDETSNNTIQSASDLGVIEGEESFGDLSIHRNASSNDQDWFRFVTRDTGGTSNYVSVEFTPSLGSVGIELYDASGRKVPNKVWSFDGENRIYLTSLSPGAYYVHTWGYDGIYNPDYTLTVNAPYGPAEDDYEPNNTRNSAKWIEDSETPLERNVLVEELSVHQPGDADWYKFNTALRGHAGNAVGIDFKDYRGDLSLALYSAAGELLDYSVDEDSDSERVSLKGLPAGTYYVAVWGATESVTQRDYDLWVHPPRPPEPDRYESNNSSVTATDLGTFTGASSTFEELSLHSADDMDWYQFSITFDGTVQNHVGLQYDLGDGELAAILFDQRGRPVAQSSGNLRQISSTITRDEISLDHLSAGTYRLAVFSPYRKLIPNYTLQIAAPELTAVGDEYELNGANDSLANATPLGLITGIHTEGNASRPLSVHNATDEDWYRFTYAGTASPGHFVSIGFDPQQGDLDLELRDTDGNILASAATSSGVERISLQGMPAGEYVARVYGHHGAESSFYSLQINVPGGDRFEDNDSREAAADLNPSVVQGLIENDRAATTVRGLEEWTDLSIDFAGDDDWFRFSMADAAVAGHQVQIEFDPTLGDLDLELYDVNGQRLAASATAGGLELVSLAGLPQSTYFVRVSGYGGALNPFYKLAIRAPEPKSADLYERNNTQATASQLGSIKGLEVIDTAFHPLSITAGDEDWFQFSIDSPGDTGHFASIVFNAAEGALNLELRDAGGNVLETARSGGGSQSVRLATRPAGTYYLRVSGRSSTDEVARYALLIRAPGAAIADWAEPNDFENSATNLGELNGWYATGGLSIDKPDDVDWYRFDLTDAGGHGHFVATGFDSFLGDLDLILIGPDGVRHESRTANNYEFFSLDGMPAGKYQLGVFGKPNPDYAIAIFAPEKASGDFAEARGEKTNNNSMQDAYDLRTLRGAQFLSGLSVHQATDVDWYQFEIAPGTTAGANDFLGVSFNNALGDLDAQLFDVDGKLLVDSKGRNRESRTSDNLERISLDGLTAGNYFLKIFGHRDATNANYSLLWQAPNPDIAPDASEPNNSSDAARDLRVIDGRLEWANLSIHNAADIDWFRFDLLPNSVGVSGQTATIQFDHAQGDLQLDLYRATDLDTPIVQSRTSGNRETVSLAGMRADQGPYYLKVSGSAQPNYTLTIDAPQAVKSDWAERHGGKTNNNSPSDAYDLRLLSGPAVLSQLSIDPAADVDLFRFEIATAGVPGQFARIDFQQASGDLTLRLRDANGNLLQTSGTALDREQVSLDGLAAGVYFLEVGGASETVVNPNYTLTVLAGSQFAPDFAELNDDPQHAFDLRELQVATRSLFGNFPALPSWPAPSWPNVNLQTGTALEPYLGMPIGSAAISRVPTWNGLLTNLQRILSTPMFGIQQTANLIDESRLGLSSANNWLGQRVELPPETFVLPYDRLNLDRTSYGLANQSIAGGGIADLLGLNSNSPFNFSANYVQNVANVYPGSALPGGASSLFGSPTNLGSGLGLGSNLGLGFGFGSGMGFGSGPVYPSVSSTSLLQLGQAGGLGGMGIGANLLSGVRLELGGGAQGFVIVSNLSVHADDDVDWFRLELPTDGTDNQFARVRFDRDQGPLSLALYSSDILSNDDGPPVETGVAEGDTLTVNLAGMPKGTYFLKVNGAANPEYALELKVASALSEDGDLAEPNESQTAAFDLRTVEGSRIVPAMSVHNDNDVDWFQFSTIATGIAHQKVSIDFDRSAGDLDLELYRADGTLIGQSIGTGDHEEIGLTGLPAGDYFMRVFGHAGATNGDYALSIDAPATRVADAAEPNNDRDSSTQLDFFTSGTRLSDLTILPGDLDLFHFTLPSVGTAADRVAIQYQADGGDLTLDLLDAGGNAIVHGDGDSGSLSATLAGQPAGVYYVRVRGATPAAANTYRLDAEVRTPLQAQADRDAWTIMVYMTANNLESFAQRDLNELEDAASRISGTANLVVFVDQTSGVVRGTDGLMRAGQTFATAGEGPWGDTGYAIIQPDTDFDRIATRFTRVGEKNSGDPDSLKDFIDWAAKEAPAEHYGLILWDHGGGLRGTNEDSESTNDALTVNELRIALEQSKSIAPFDLIAFDACLMAMTEVGASLQGVSKLLVGSEENMPGEGMDFRTAFDSLAGNTFLATSADVASGMVESYATRYGGSRNETTYSATAFASWSEFERALGQFTAAMRGAGEADWEAARRSLAGVPRYGGESYRDLGRYLINVARSSASAVVRDAAQAASNALDRVVVARTQDYRSSRGLSIFLPELGDADRFADELASYRENFTDFLAATHWDDLIVGLGANPSDSSRDDVDWAGQNSDAARAFNLHELVGPNHHFDGLRTTPGQDDWFRFSRRLLPNGSLDVGSFAPQFDSLQGQLTFEVYYTDAFADRDAPQGARTLLETTTENGHVIEFYSFEFDELYLRVINNNRAVEYGFTINGGESDTNDDWVRGNNRETKASHLGLVSGNTFISGLRAFPQAGEWYTFSTPRHESTDSRGIVISPTQGDVAYTAELLDTEGRVLESASGEGPLTLHYLSGAGANYRVKIAPNDNQLLAYSLALNTPVTSLAPSVLGMPESIELTELVPPALRFGSVVVHDSDSSNFRWGTLTVSGTTGLGVMIAPQGNDAGQVSLADRQIMLGGVLIGTIDSTSSAGRLAATFNAAADDAAVQAVVRRLAIQAGDDESIAGPHQVTFELTDGDGGRFRANVVVDVTGANRPPQDVRVSSNAVRENVLGAIVGLLSASDPDADQGLTFTTIDERFEIVEGVLRLKPDRYIQGTETMVSVVVTDNGLPPRSTSQEITLNVIANPRAWRNSVKPLDTNGDGVIAPLDALLIINEINVPAFSGPGGQLPVARPNDPSLPLLDTDGDGFCAPLDVLGVINHLNDGLAEGEPGPFVEPILMSRELDSSRWDGRLLECSSHSGIETEDTLRIDSLVSHQVATNKSSIGSQDPLRSTRAKLDSHLEEILDSISADVTRTNKKWLANRGFP